MTTLVNFLRFRSLANRKQYWFAWGPILLLGISGMFIPGLPWWGVLTVQIVSLYLWAALISARCRHASRTTLWSLIALIPAVVILLGFAGVDSYVSRSVLGIPLLGCFIPAAWLGLTRGATLD